MEDMESAIAQLRNSIAESLHSHRKRRLLDSWLHNGGTVLVILANSLAAVLARHAEVSLQVVLLTTASTALIAMDRALSFGARWQIHIRMANAYSALLDRIETLKAFPPEARTERLDRILHDLDRIRQEPDHPGTSGTASA